MPCTKLIVFAKAPLRGFSKTRLIPDLGEAGAQQLAEKLLQHTLCCLKQLNNIKIELCLRPTLDHVYWQQLNDLKSFELTNQIDGHLGEVQYYAAARAFKKNDQVIIIGTDCPELTADLINEVVNKLMDYDACIIPAIDGGYVLLALKDVTSDLFANISWSTNKVYEQIMFNMNNLAWKIYEFPSMVDIDTVDDLLLLNKQAKKFYTKEN